MRVAGAAVVAGGWMVLQLHQGARLGCAAIDRRMCFSEFDKLEARLKRQRRGSCAWFSCYGPISGTRTRRGRICDEPIC
jgi:hypothetical protein